MRNYGYPPGWLKEAEVKESGLQVKEEGEVNELNHIDISEGPELTLTGLDASKIISYPGFNTPLPDNCNDNPPKRVPKFSRTDNKNDFINTFCKRNKIKCIQKRKVSREEPDSSETSAKKVSTILSYRYKRENKVKLEDEEAGSEEFTILDETKEEPEKDGFGEEEKPVFQPGWVAKEGEETDETSNKGLPSRNKWQDGITQFDYNAYQPAPAKQGTYLKLQKTLQNKE